ncbi:MAG: hypothetical protein U0984_12250 [Prosthecobacter sp.]|nr:hypothetical protein [Prosthecobacter sp.]
MKKSTLPIAPPAAFLTPADLRARWKVSAMFLWRLRRAGRLSGYKIGTRGVRFALADVMQIESESRA